MRGETSMAKHKESGLDVLDSMLDDYDFGGIDCGA